MTERIGIMGGTFDPIHCGHLDCASLVGKHLELDRILFIPTGNPSFKQGMTNASPVQRLEMVSLAIRDFAQFEVDDREVRRQGVSYSVDTLQELKEAYPPETEFYFIAGMDCAASLHRWYRVEELAKLCRFVFVSRSGYSYDEMLEAQLIMIPNLSYTVVDGFDVPVSSTYLRQAICKGEDVESLLPAAVWEYIRNHNLYVCASGRTL